VSEGDERQQAPSPIVFTLVVSAALGYAAYLSPQRWTAAGLACITTSALIATPELVEHLLLTTKSPRARRVAGWLARSFWILTRFGYALLGLLAVVLLGTAALGEVAVRDAFTFAAVAVGLIAGGEILRRRLAGLVADLVGGGELDKALYERHDEWRWLLAGALFLAGTLMQLVGTFAE
jgi:hypothetical protein